MKKEKPLDRFVEVYTQNGLLKGTTIILVDRETGVNYLWYSFGHAGGMTVLLGADGKPVVTPVAGPAD